MPSWSQTRKRREAINSANHQSGWSPATRIIGGVDDPSLGLLTSADVLTPVWSAERNDLHLLATPEQDAWARLN